MRSIVRAGASLLVASSLILPALAQDSSSSSSSSSSESSSAESSSSSSQASSVPSSSSSRRPTLRDLVNQARANLRDAKSTQTQRRGNMTRINMCTGVEVATRETALQTAFAKFSASITTAYQVRATALSAAWVNTDAKERKSAIDVAWRTFNGARKAAADAYRKENKTAWDSFRSSCKDSTPEPSAGELNVQ